MNESMIKRDMLSGAQEARTAERDWVDGLEEDEQDDLGTIKKKIDEVVADLSGAYKKEEVIRLSERLLRYYKDNDINSDIKDHELAADVQRAIRVAQAERRRREKEEQAQISEIQDEMRRAGKGEKTIIVDNKEKLPADAEKKSGIISGIKSFFSR